MNYPFSVFRTYYSGRWPNGWCHFRWINMMATVPWGWKSFRFSSTVIPEIWWPSRWCSRIFFANFERVPLTGSQSFYLEDLEAELVKIERVMDLAGPPGQARHELAKQLESRHRNCILYGKSDSVVHVTRASLTVKVMSKLSLYFPTDPEKLKPLVKVASKWELSCLMLAIKSAFSNKGKTSIKSSFRSWYRSFWS